MQLAQARDGFLDGHNDGLACGTHADLDLAISQRTAHNEAERHADQLVVLELHAGTNLTAVVDEDVKACLLYTSDAADEL